MVKKVSVILGYGITEETKPGVWEQHIVEKQKIAEYRKNTSSVDNSDKVNQNININNQISIIADPFSLEHYTELKYVKMLGVYWKVNSIDILEHPRILISYGGIYNEEL